MKNNFIKLILIIFACLLLVSCANNKKENIDEDVYNKDTAVIVIKNYGEVKVKLDKTNAPITCNHFIKLASEGSYDGSVFTRMQADFVLQGGANAKDSSTIKGEFKANGVDNNLAHKTGVISMARSNDPNSASSQFFIVIGDKYVSSLDGSYAGFGWIIEGYDVIEKIVSDITSDMFTNDYYGQEMGFLKESYYITIETIKIE